MTKPTRGRPFKPGESGNPAGKPKGTRDRRSVWRETLAGELDPILAALVAKAKSGDVQAAALILSRTCAPLRPSRAPIDVPGIPEGATATEIATALVRAATRGELPSDAAAELVAAHVAVARLREVDELAARLEALEARHHAG